MHEVEWGCPSLSPSRLFLPLNKLDLEVLEDLEELAAVAGDQPRSRRVDDLDLGQHLGDGDLDLVEGEALSDAHTRPS